MGTVRREPIETPLAEGSVAGVRSGISGDRALDPWACGRRTARGQSWSPGAGRCRGPPPFSVWDLEIAVAELFGNSRSQQLAGGKPSGVLALCWILESAERDRSLNLLGKGVRVFLLRAVSSCARGRRRGATGTVRREPIETPLAEGSVAGVRSGLKLETGRLISSRLVFLRWPRAVRRPHAAFSFCAPFPRAREGGASASGVSIRRRPRIKSPIACEESDPKERLSVSNWIVQGLYDDCSQGNRRTLISGGLLTCS